MNIKRIILKLGKSAKKYFLRTAKRLMKKRNFWPAIKIIAVLLFILVVTVKYIDSKKIAPTISPAQSPAAAEENFSDKVGQMLMIGFRGTEISSDSYIAKAEKELNLGGVILFDRDVPSKSARRNITNPKQTKKLVADLKSFSQKEPLLVAVDAEGGLVNRLNPSLGFADIPSAQELGKEGNGPALDSYWDLAQEISNLGINLNFGPVVDVNINPENPVIGGLKRSYSAAPDKIATMARSFIAAHRSFGILTALKHFPGHGSSNSDSHLGFADVTNTYQQSELLPYEQLLKENAVDAVMTAHIINRQIDPDYPATLSPLFIQNILREKLGFEGVVFSDDMQMGAITDSYSFDDSIIRAINAGCDFLIFSNND